jgi:hypothetical protein
MLPDTFSSANACARIPVTAVVRAPKIPMTRLQLPGGRPGWREEAAMSGSPSQATCHIFIRYISITYGKRAAAPDPDLPVSGKICR